jgi:hypothetical protein
MFTTILIILVVLAAIIAVLAVVVVIQPSDFRIARTSSMKAAPSEVFAQVNDFHNWASWSPWERLDPTAKKSFEGPSAGTGAVHTWNGNNKVGEGTMTIIESKPNDLIQIKLEFRRPFKANNTSEFTFVPEGNQVRVTWSMSCRHNFVMKAMSMFMNMDKMVGADFENGLANMKSVVETNSKS